MKYILFGILILSNTMASMTNTTPAAPRFANSNGKLRSFFKNSHKDAPSSYWTAKISGKTYVVQGNTLPSTKNQIKTLLDEGSELYDRDLEIYLTNSNLFSSVKVVTTGSTTKVTLVEYPLLGKANVTVHGGAGLPKDKLDEILQLKKRDHVSPDKIAEAVQNLKMICSAQNSTSNVEVEVYQKIDRGVAELTFVVNVHPEKQIKDIIFHGNQKLSSHALKKAIEYNKKLMNPLPMVTVKTISGNEFFINKMSKEVTEYAEALGYLDFKVKSATIEENEFQDKFLHIVVEEGPRYTIKEVKFDSTLDDKEHSLLNKRLKNISTRLKVGQPFLSKLFKDFKSQMVRLITEKRLYEYEVVTEYVKDGDQVVLKYNVAKQKNPQKLGRIFLVNNNKTDDKTIMQILSFTPGDCINQDMLDQAKTDLLATGVFKEIEISLVDTKNSNVKDVKIEFTEENTIKIEASLNGSTGNDDGIGGNVSWRDVNTCGKGIGFGASLSLLGSSQLNTRIEIPNLFGKWNWKFYAEFGISESSIGNSNLFGPGGGLEMLWALLTGAYDNGTYPTIPTVVSKLRDGSELKTDLTARQRALDNYLSPYWEDKKRPKGTRELRTSMKFGTIMPLDDNNYVGLELGINHRAIQYDKYSTEKEFFVKDQNTQQNSARVSISGPNGSIYERLEHRANVATLGLPQANGRYYDRVTGNTIVDATVPATPLHPTLRAQLLAGQIVTVLASGVGLNPILRQQGYLDEKLEFCPTFQYNYMNYLPEFDMKYDIGLSITSVLGTTQALKFILTASVGKKLSDHLSLVISAKVGRSINGHYLDNFTPGELGLCKACGPIELYDFTYLGGRSMAKVGLQLNLDIFKHHIANITPYLRLSFGSLWDSGVEPYMIPTDLAAKRNWPIGTLDVAQNDFNIITVLTPGVQIKWGPLMMGIGLNFKVADSNPNLNATSGIGGLDFSVGFEL